MTITAPARLSALFAAPALLRTSLRLDALVTGVNGVAYLALSGPIESLLGLDASVGIPIGIFLTLYALAVAAIGLPASINTAAAKAVVAANAAWVVVSLAAPAEGALDVNRTGAIWAVLQAAVVGGLAALQYAGVRKAR